MRNIMSGFLTLAILILYPNHADSEDLVKLPEEFLGEYDLVVAKDVNFNAYLKKTELPLAKQVLVKKVPFRKTIAKSSGKPEGYYDTSITSSVFSSRHANWNIDKEFTGKTLDGHDSTILFTLSSDGKIFYEQFIVKGESEKDIYEMHREGEFLVATFKKDGVVAKRYLRKIS